MANQDDARRVQNKSNAILLARNGIPVFPSSGKVPLVKLYNRRDTEIGADERDAAIEKAREEGNNALTVFVGATTSPDSVKRLWRQYKEAVPSIACGPAKLVVIDADVKFNGPALIAKLFEENGGVPEGCIVTTTQSGGRHYVFSDPDSAFTNSAGQLKKQYGCDVRGRGGQFIAPGSIREDGKRYGDSKTLNAFVEAYAAGTIPPLPDYIVELIGTSSSDVGENDVPVSKERDVTKQLEQSEVPEWEELCTPLGDYEFDKLQNENTEFKQLYNDPSDDCSDNRFKAARHVMREWPEMPPEHLASFFSSWDGAGEFVDSKPGSGEYDNRQTAREWLKNQGLSKSSTGDKFADVSEEVAREDTEYKKAAVDGNDETESAPASITDTMYYANDAAFYTCANYIVENLCAPGQIGVLYGASNIGKTFAVIHLGDCVSEGKPWFDKQTDRSGVLYLFAEGKAQFNNRLAAYRVKYPSDGKGMVVHKGIPPLGGDEVSRKRGIKDMRKAIKEANKWQAEHGLPPVRFVFIDTFAKAVAGAEENSAKEMQPILNALRQLAEDEEVIIVIVHHTGKDATAGSRGSYAIYADADFELEVMTFDTVQKKKLGIEMKPRQLAILSGKMRDGAKGGAHLFELEEVTLGLNKWGNPATSVVFVPVGQSSTGDAFGDVSSDEDDGLTSGLLACDSLEDYILEHVGRKVAGAADANAVPVLLSGDLREALTQALDHFAPASRAKIKDPARLAEARRKQLGRALDSLAAQGRLTIEPTAGRESILRFNL